MKINKTDLKRMPSLLEPQSRGGDIGEGGIDFQLQATLVNIPQWLGREGFASMIRESMGDFEARFFIPGDGEKIELLEAKNHRVNNKEFWDEVERYKQLEAAAGGNYSRFILVCTDTDNKISPILQSIQRLRGSEGFYTGTPIMDQSYKDYIAQVIALGKTESDAEFLLKKVFVESNNGALQSNGKALFLEQLASLPYCENLNRTSQEQVYEKLSTFIRSRRNETILRAELEKIILSVIPDQDLHLLPPVQLYTAGPISGDRIPENFLTLPWTQFFGGQNRDYPSPQEWNSVLLVQLTDTRDWILKNRNTRSIVLRGNRRLSAAVGVGWAFSAVGGFQVQEEYREGVLWATNDHANESTADYDLTSEENFKLKSNRLIVSLGIGRNIYPDVQGALAELGLDPNPALNIFGLDPVTGPQQANLIVAKVKRILTDAVRQVGVEQIDLFFAGPSPVALFLGHRVNAIVKKIQCYEFQSASHYLPTCLLINGSSK